MCNVSTNSWYKFQNTSVLENHHWRSAIGCLLESGVSAQLSDNIRSELERHIKSLILATDITRQQEFLTRFRVRINHMYIRTRIKLEDFYI